MSAAEGRNGAGPSVEGLDLAALHARVRCGRSQPLVRHLAESDEAFGQRHRMREVIVLCSAEVAESDPDVDEIECLGCRDCFRYCPTCLREANRWSGASFLSASGDDPGHPAWCSPQHCYRIEEGDRVHQSAPARWEDCEVRFEITLVGPEHDRTYVELQLTSLEFPDGRVYAAMPVPAARRLRDELTAHLDAAAAERHHVARNGVGGVAGLVMMSSDPDTSGTPEDSSTTETGAEVPDPAAPNSRSDPAA